MNKTYVTFGQSHAHRVGSQTFDKDSVAVIHHEGDAREGRESAFRLFDAKFCFSYFNDQWDEEKSLRHFPRGYLHLDVHGNKVRVEEQAKMEFSRYIVMLLHNESAGTYHPAYFMKDVNDPNGDRGGDAQRYVLRAQHAVGFPTRARAIDMAKKFVELIQGASLSVDIDVQWDGKEAGIAFYFRRVGCAMAFVS